MRFYHYHRWEDYAVLRVSDGLCYGRPTQTRHQRSGWTRHPLYQIGSSCVRTCCSHDRGGGGVGGGGGCQCHGWALVWAPEVTYIEYIFDLK